jgi:uncharacterized protein YdeI (YjbR/CyaY-like superfamily)
MQTGRRRKTCVITANLPENEPACPSSALKAAYRTTIAVYGGRHFDLPEGLRSALHADAEAVAAFDRLSYTHKKELVQWVTGAKRVETQRRRMAQAMGMLRPPPAGR